MSKTTVQYCPRSRARAINAFLRQFLGHGGAQIGLLCLVFFVALAAIPNILVGPLQTAVNATGCFLGPPSAEHLLGGPTMWDGTCSIWSSMAPESR